ncbi:thiamine phosphate synthase [Nocardioides sp. SYSU D00065]|uniref:thiamine phosphate synthase n=1 Tax=Nocardioides sp. SYSU D00065 TaxID=2817378 RepID=UPI001B3438FA|nr:thiamine phosphate synthase [Nocardioides sp. SYSU D00065]
MTLPRLLLLTDRSQLRLGRGLLRTLFECVEAGATHVVIRELDLSADRRAALVGALAGTGATVLAAHTPVPGCAGVHLPATAPRAQGGSGLVGRSCHTIDDVERAAAEGADLATLSPFAASRSKPGYGPPIDPAHLAGHALPVFALGGITRDNAAAAMAAGAHGVAVMGEVMRSARPAVTVSRLLEAVS